MTQLGKTKYGKTIAFDLDGTLVQLKPKIQSFVDRVTLIKLSQDYQLAIVTGATRAETKPALKLMKIDMLFNENLIITADNISAPKITGEPFRELLRRINGAVIMIGDSDSDDIGTKITDIPFVRVSVATTIPRQRANLARAIKSAVEFHMTK